LDEAEVDTVFQEMSGIGMSQSVHVRPLGDAALEESASEGGLEAAVGDGAGPFGDEVASPAPDGGRKEPLWGAVGAPVFAQAIEGGAGEGDVAVAASLAVNVEEHPVALDIGDSEASPLEEPQAAGIDRDQTGAVNGQAHTAEDAADLLTAENDGKLLLPWRARETEEGPLSTEGGFEEELDAAQRDGEARAGEVLDVDEIEEVLAELCLGDPIEWFAQMRGELADCVDVGFLGPCGETPKLHILDHATAEWRHGVSFPGGDRRPDQDAP